MTHNQHKPTAVLFDVDTGPAPYAVELARAAAARHLTVIAVVGDPTRKRDAADRLTGHRMPHDTLVAADDADVDGDLLARLDDHYDLIGAVSGNHRTLAGWRRAGLAVLDTADDQTQPEPETIEAPA